MYITKEQKNRLSDLLLENEGTNMKRARKYLESKGYSPEQRQQILDSIRTDIPNSRLNQCKFLLGVTRLYMEGQLNNGNAIANLNKTLKYIASDAHVNEYDFNLNGENLDTLVERFAGVAREDLEQSRNASNARQLTVNNDYTIVPIDNPEEAAKYGDYTSWCVTHYPDMYESYTHEGTGRFYFCLRKGFENEPEVQSEGCPLDSYGLSMIAVSVTEEGEVNTITCRWNHSNGGNDNIMTIEQLENLLGRNFYKTFKPYNREELLSKGIIPYNAVEDLLKSGKNPEEIFSYVVYQYSNNDIPLALVKLRNKLNFLNEKNEITLPKWVDFVSSLYNGFFTVRIGNKKNFANNKGELIGSTWYDDTFAFNEFGLAHVSLNGKGNIINCFGEPILKEWIDFNVYKSLQMIRCDDKLEVYKILVKKDDTTFYSNFINNRYVFLSDKWFDHTSNFNNDLAIVGIGDIENRKYNVINKNGEFILKKWVEDPISTFQNGYGIVFSKEYLLSTMEGNISQRNNISNVININGDIISKQWFKKVLNIDTMGNYGFCHVELEDGKYMKLDADGTLFESKNSPKTIIITEEQKKLLKENILLDKVPEDITNAILHGKTSLKNNPAIPNVFENSYLETVIKKRFNETIDELKKIGEINDVPETDIPTVLNKLILKCQELEKPYRSELEKLCYNYVIGLFEVPDDTVTVDFRLVDEVDLNKSSIKLDPIHDDSDEIEYEDIKQFSTISDEVYKRRMLNVLAMGAGLQVSSDIKSYLSDIYDINPKLPDLYRKIIALNNYLLLTKETLGMSEENKMQIGTVEITLGNEDDKVKIEAQGEIFPVLLSECVRGFMELFASHGLPKDKEILDIVLAKSDYLKAEPWDMRIGPSLWTILSENFEGIDFKTVPYLFKKISSLSCKNFNKFMQEVLAKTKTGKRLMGKLIEKSKTEKEYNKFSDKMSKLQTDKNVITDEYIHPEEL